MIILLKLPISTFQYNRELIQYKFWIILVYIKMWLWYKSWNWKCVKHQGFPFHAAAMSQAANLPHMLKKNVTRSTSSFSRLLPSKAYYCQLQPVLLVNPIKAPWQVKWKGPKGRTLEGNILINNSICSNNTGRSGETRGNNSFGYHVNLGLFAKMAANRMQSNLWKLLSSNFCSNKNFKRKKKANIGMQMLECTREGYWEKWGNWRLKLKEFNEVLQK